MLARARKTCNSSFKMIPTTGKSHFRFISLSVLSQFHSCCFLRLLRFFKVFYKVELYPVASFSMFFFCWLVRVACGSGKTINASFRHIRSQSREAGAAVKRVFGILLPVLLSIMLLAVVLNVRQAWGAVQWSKNYGGVYPDYCYALVQTGDGGYALAGMTGSYGVSGDFWLVKTEANGNMQWNNTYGGIQYDEARALVQTSDGGYALAGYTMDEYRYCNSSLVKTDENGNMQWNRTYGDGAQKVYALVQTSDGGYALAGYTGGSRWLVKTDANGDEQWTKSYGGAGYYIATALVQTGDGGYALAGSKATEYAGYDFWLVKTDANGNVQWSNTYGGTGSDWATALVQTADGGYALAGTTTSYGAGRSDFWLVKTGANGDAQWRRSYGGTGDEGAESVVQTSDGGYALAGTTDSLGAGSEDFWLVKTDASGNALENRTFGGVDEDRFYGLVQTGDGGYALAGYTESYSVGYYDFWLVKTDVMIPEFPSNLVLAAFMVTATVTVILTKRKHRTRLIQGC
jgi:hypothetical protein